MFKAFVVRLGPIHFSIVINELISRGKSRRLGGFITWDHRFFASCLRIGWVYVNFDIC